MKRIVIAGAVACLLATAACTPKDLDDTFAQVCASVPLADAGFRIYASNAKVSRDVKQAEKQAVAAAQAVCAGGRPTDVASALVAVTDAMAAIAKATKKAKVQANS